MTGPAWPRGTAQLIDHRDSDFSRLPPLTFRCQACGVIIAAGRPRSRQHRVARGMGGRKGGLFSSCVNGVTLCGSATTPWSCHLRAESRQDPGMRRRGFVVGGNMRPDLLVAELLATPLVLWDGRVAWPTQDGKWIDEAPAVTA